MTPCQSTTCATPQTGPSSPWTITSPSQYSYSCQPGGKSTLTTARKQSCCTSNFVSLVAVTQQKVIPSTGTTFPKGTPVSETSVEKTVVILLELFSESLIDDDAVFAKKTPLAKAEAEGNLFSQTGRSSYEIAKMHNQQHCARGYSHHRYNNREGSPQTNH